MSSEDKAAGAAAVRNSPRQTGQTAPPPKGDFAARCAKCAPKFQPEAKPPQGPILASPCGGTVYHGGPCRIRTCDQVIMSHTGAGCKALPEKGLQDGESSVTPSVTPESEKAVILAALRGLDRDTLLDLLADALGGAKAGQ